MSSQQSKGYPYVFCSEVPKTIYPDQQSALNIYVGISATVYACLGIESSVNSVSCLSSVSSESGLSSLAVEAV